jgi:hypothetical protein
MVHGVPTSTSRAASDVISPTLIFQLAAAAVRFETNLETCL